MNNWTVRHMKWFKHLESCAYSAVFPNSLLLGSWTVCIIYSMQWKEHVCIVQYIHYVQYYSKDNLSSHIDLGPTTEWEIQKLTLATKEGPDKQVNIFQRKYLLITLRYFHLLMPTDISSVINTADDRKRAKKNLDAFKQHVIMATCICTWVWLWLDFT